MRAKPSNWFRSLQAAGFRRRARHSRPFASRPLKVEDLESRILLTINTDLTANSAPVVTSATTIVLDSLSSPQFRIADVSAQQVFSVDTVNDPQNGLEAVLRMSSNAPANLQTTYEFDVVLSASNQDVATYHVQVVLPGLQMLRELRVEHTQEAKAVVSTAANSQGLPVATLNADGDFIEGATVTATTEDGLSVTASLEDAAEGDTHLPVTEDISEATPISSAPATITDVSTRLDLLAPLATAIAQDAVTPMSVQNRVNIYAGLANLASDIDTASGGQTSSTADQDNAHRIGADLDLMAAQMKADMASGDPVLAAAAKQAYDAALAQSDLYFRLWSGQGINSEVYAQPAGQNTQYSVFYETGYVQVTNQIAVDLGRSALVMVSSPQGLGVITGRSSYFTNYTTNWVATAATYVDVTPASATAHNGTNSPSFIVSKSATTQQDGFLRFSLNGITADQITSATLSLDATYISATAVTVSAQPEPNTTWDESTLVWSPIPSGLSATRSSVDPIWQPTSTNAGLQQLTVTDAVKKAIRVGDADFSDNHGSILHEIEAFHTLLDYPWAYMAQYGTLGTLTENAGSGTAINGVAINKETLYRGDTNFDGKVDSGDIAPFLAMHNITAGDVNLDGIVNGQDVAAIASGTASMGVFALTTYAQGDANLDAIVNGQDIALVASNWLISSTPAALVPQLTLRLSSPSNGSVTFASEYDATASNRPTLNISQTPEVAIRGFSTVANGASRALAVSYWIGSPQTSTDAIPDFRIGIYKSADGATNGALITSYSVSHALNEADFAPGNHTILIPASSAFDTDIIGTGYLRAVLDDLNSLNGPVTVGNSMVFEGGAFNSANGSLQVQGPNVASVGLQDLLTINASSIGINGTIYNNVNVTGTVYVHTHGYGEIVTLNTTAAATINIFGGGGTNSLIVTANSIGVAGTHVTAGSAIVNLSNFQSLNVNTIGTAAAVSINGAAAGLAVSVTAGSNTATSLSVANGTNLSTYNVSSSTIQINGTQWIAYAGLSSLTFAAGTSNDSINILGDAEDAFVWKTSTSSYVFDWVAWLKLQLSGFASVALSAPDGSLSIDRHDTTTAQSIALTNTAATVDGLGLTYSGFTALDLGGGTNSGDSLVITDNSQTNSISVNSSGKLVIGHLPLISLASVEILNVFDTYSAGVMMTVQSLPTGLQEVLFSASGSNSTFTLLPLPATLQDVEIYGGSGTNTLSVTTSSSQTSTILSSGLGGYGGKLVTGGTTISYGNFRYLNLSTGSGDDSVSVNSLPNGLYGFTLATDGGNDSITVNSLVTGLQSLAIVTGTGSDSVTIAGSALPSSLSTLSVTAQGNATFTLPALIPASAIVTLTGGSGADTLKVTDNVANVAIANSAGQLKIDNLPAITLNSIENLQVTDSYSGTGASMTVASLPNGLQNLTLNGSSVSGTTFVLPNVITSLQAVTVAGATGGNNILQLTTAAQAPVITVDSNQKFKVGSLPAISLNAIPNIQITDSFSSGANVDVQALPSGLQSFSLFTDGGSDNVTIQASALPSSLSQLSLSDTAGTNTFQDNAPLTSNLSLSVMCGSTGANTLSLTTSLSSAPISKDSSGRLLIDGLSPITLGNVQTLQVTDPYNNGGSGATVTVNSVPASVLSLAINTDGGNDSFIVNEPATGSLPTLTFNAGNGSDSVTINDLARATSQSVTIGSSTIAVSGTTTDPPINYSGVESLNVNTDGGDDQFLLANLPSGLNVSIDGGAGSNTLSISTGSTGDVFSVSNTQVKVNSATVTYSNIQNLVLDADGNTASQDSLTLTGAAGADQFVLSGSGAGGGTSPFIVTWNEGPKISGKNFERVTLAADSGNSLTTVTGTLPGVAVTLQGGSADDTFVDQQFAAGSLSIDGGSGTNVVDLSSSSLNNLSALPNLNNIQTLDLSHNNFTSAPALTGNLSATLTTLDLRYNAIDLSAAGTLAALSPQNSIRQLYLFGNKTAADGSTNLVDLAGTYLRVDLAPVRLDQAEAQSIANMQMHTTHPLHPIVQALHYLPLEIYDYVVNNYAFQLYGGQVKGDQGVIATHAGNDVDQTILLQDLLKEIGVVSTLQTVTNTGGVSGLLVPVVDMEKWLGVQNLDAVRQLFSNASVVYTPVTSVSGGPITGIAISHTWLGSIGGASNLVFDPSWKVLNSSSNIATFLSNRPGNFHSVGQIVAETQNASFVPTDTYNPFTSLSFYTAASSTNEVAYEWFQNQTSKWMAQNAPGYTLADLSYNTTIQPIMTVNGQIPIAPRGVLGGVLSTVYEPGDQQEYVRFILKGSDNSDPQQLDLAIPAIDMEEISVRWGGANNLTATLYVGEEPKLSRTYSSNDHTFNFEFGFIAPGSNRTSPNLTLDRDTIYSRPIGKVIAVGINAGQITPALVAREQALVTSDALPVLQNHSTISSFGDRQIAHVLALAMTQYFALVDEGQKVADGIFQTIQDRGHISAGIVSADTNLSILGQSITTLSDSNIHDDSQIPIVPNGLFVDVPRNTYSATSVAGDLDDAKQREYLISASSSSQESDIFEQLLNTSTISTVRSFQLANQSAVGIDSFTYSIGLANEAQTWANYVANELRNSGDLTYDSSGQTGQINKLTQVLAAEPAGSTVHLYLPVKQTKITGSGSSTLWQGYTYFLAVDRPDGSYTNLWFIDGSTGSSGGGGQPYGYEIDEEDLVPLLPQRSAKVGDPMNVANGAAYEDVQDISISNIGLPLTFSRHYDSSVVSNSVSTNDPTAAGDPMLGRGWFGTYSDHLYVDGSGNAHWRNNQGQLYTFTYSAGTYSTPLGLTGEFRKVTASDYGGSYVSDYLFRDSTGVSRVLNPGSGHLDAISNLDGDVLRLQWTSTGFSVFDENTTRVLYFNYNSASDTTLKNVTLGGASSNQWLYGVSNGYLTSVTDPGATSPTYAYAYFGVNNATANNSSDGTAGTPIAQRLAEVVLPDGGEIKYSYYANGRVFQVTNPDQSVQTIEYDAFANNATFVDERGNRTDYFYNSSGFQTKVSYPDGSIETKIWGDGSTNHPVDKPEYSTDVYGLTTFYTYYPDTYFSHAGGRFGAVQRSDVGRLGWNNGTPIFNVLDGIANTSSNGTTPVWLTTTYTYATAANTVAALSQPQSTTAPATFKFLLPQTTSWPSDSSLPHKTGLVYDQYGNVVEQLQYIDANTTIETDISYYPTTSNEWYAGLVSEKKVLTAGTVISDTTYEHYDTSSSNGKARNAQAGEIDRWISDTTVNGQVIHNWTSEHYSYDFETGAVTSSINANSPSSTDDAKNYTTSYFVDAYGRVTDTKLPIVLDATTGNSVRPEPKASYNQDGTVKDATDADGRVTKYTYDTMQRVIKTEIDTPTGVVASIVTNTYDAAGNKISQTDADGHVTRFVYDNRNRPIETMFAVTVAEQLASGTGHLPASTTSYNGRGQPVISTDALGNQTINTYDQFGRVASVQLPDPDGTAPQLHAPLTKYTYDAAGNRLSTTVTTVAAGAGTAVTQYVYDGLNRLVQQTDPAPGGAGGGHAPRWSYTYDALGNVLTKKLVDTTSPTVAVQLTTSTYDGVGHLRTMTEQNGTNPSVWIYNYDNVGNRIKSTDPNSNETVFQYDNLNRLKEQDNPDASQWNYQYDLVGNVQTATLTGQTYNAAGSHHTATLSQTKTFYDALNRPAIKRAYDATGSLLTTTTTTYDGAGNLLSTTDGLGNLTRFTYDARNRRISVTDPLGNETTTEYDANGNITSVTDPLGNVPGGDTYIGGAKEATTYYKYDSLNRLLTTQLPNLQRSDLLLPAILTNVYDDRGYIVTTYQGRLYQSFERKTDYTYDNLHRKTQELDPADAEASPKRLETDYTYDVAGNVLTKSLGTQDAPGQYVTQYKYDALGRLLKEQDPDPDGAGSAHPLTTYFGYYPNGKVAVLQTVDPVNNATLSYVAYNYDAMNRRNHTSTFDVQLVPAPQSGDSPAPLPQSQAYSETFTLYDGAGHAQLVQDALQRSTFTDYDGLGRAIDERQLDHNDAYLTQTLLNYDASGNLVRSTVKAVGSSDADRTTTYAYDADGHQIRSTDPLGHMTSHTYDVNGNVRTTTDALGNTTSYTYDELNRVMITTVPTGSGTSATTKTDYDEFGNVVYVLNPDGTHINRSFDAQNHVTTERKFGTGSTELGQTQTYVYDWLGHLQSETDHNGQTVNYSYDLYGHELSESWTWPGGQVEVLSYQYTTDGKLASADDKLGTVQQSHYDYAYDQEPLRRLRFESFTQPTVTSTQVATWYTYDKDGELLTRLTNPFGSNAAYQTAYTYDDAGREQTAAEQTAYGGSTFAQGTFGWDYSNSLRTIGRSAGGPTTSVTTDIAGRITQIQADGLQLNYSYDADNRVVSETDVNPVNSAVTGTNAYTYDAASQVLAATHSAGGPANETYSYDANGNRMVTPSTGQQAYDEWHRLQNDGVYTYSYDASGNLTKQIQLATGQVTTYTWDPLNRLIQIEVYPNSTSQTELAHVEYRYDPFGNRILKTNITNYGATVSSTSYVYTSVAPTGGSTSDPILSRSASGANIGQATHRYLYAPGPGSTDQLLADNTLIVASGTTNTTGIRWALNDQQGTTRRLINTAGTDVADFNFDTFGQLAPGSANPAAVDYLLGFEGGEYDDEIAAYNGGTGLVRFDARYYNPRTGQFLSTDPAGADTNPYRYAGNDPVNASDPSGLMTRSIYGSLSASALFGGTAGLRGLVDAALAEDEEFNIGSFYSGLGSSRSTSSYSLPLLNTGARLPTSSTYDIGTSWGSGSTYGSSTSSSLLTSLSSSGTSSWLSSLGGASSAGAAYNLGLLPPLLAPQSGLAANPVFGTTSYAGNFGTAVTGNLGAMALNTIEQSVQNVLGGAQATAAQAGSLYSALSNGEYGSAAKQYAAFNLGNGSASSLLAIGPGSIPNLPNLQTILGGIASAIDPAAAGRGVQSAPFTDLGVSIAIGGVSTRSNAPSTFVEQMAPAEAARYEAYWGSRPGSPLRYRDQAAPGTQVITDTKISSITGETYARDSIYDQFGRRIGTNDYTTHGLPDHADPHFHTRDPISGERNGPFPGLHPDTP